MGEENPQEPAYPVSQRAKESKEGNEPHCQVKGGWTITGQPGDRSKTRSVAADEARRREVTGQYQKDQQDQSAATSHNKFRRSDEGCRNTTQKRKPTNAGKSGEKTHSTQRVDTSRRNTQGNRKQSPRSEQRWEVPMHTSPWEGEPNAKAHNQTRQKKGKPPVRLQAEEHSPDLRYGTPTRRPVTKPSRRKEGLHYDRGLRKNTVPTWDRWPPREDPKPRRTEEPRGTAAPEG